MRKNETQIRKIKQKKIERTKVKIIIIGKHNKIPLRVFGF